MSLQLYWGDLHSHCSVSYGHGTPAQALLRAAQQLDFASITGHAFWPDMPTDRSRYADIIDYHTQGFATLATNWDELIDIEEQASEPGRFIVFPSYEWHSLAHGDHNVYAVGPQLPLQDGETLEELRRRVASIDGLMIPHHIGYRAGYRGINWETYTPEISPFVEIFSLHGASVSENAPYPMLHTMGPRDRGSMATAGWAMGHRFGIVGGTDHHAAYPGSHGDGRMGVFAESLTREALWDAFKARRVFAATGDRIDARLFLNDAWIGESVHAPGKRRLHFRVEASDSIERVELLKNERIIGRYFPKPADTQSGPYRLRLVWGWGRTEAVVNWEGKLTLSEGRIAEAQSCFAGQTIVAPEEESHLLDIEDLPHALDVESEQRIRWRSITTGNPSPRQDATQAISLLLDAPLSAEIALEVNGVKIRHQLGELLSGGVSHPLQGWLSETLRIGPLVPRNEWFLEGSVEDEPQEEVDIYRLRVGQHNGQWAWLTPIWAEQ